MRVTERCGRCRDTGGWHMSYAVGVASDQAPEFHHVWKAVRDPAIKVMEQQYRELKANAALTKGN